MASLSHGRAELPSLAALLLGGAILATEGTYAFLGLAVAVVAFGLVLLALLHGAREPHESGGSGATGGSGKFVGPARRLEARASLRLAVDRLTGPFRPWLRGGLSGPVTWLVPIGLVAVTATAIVLGPVSPLSPPRVALAAAVGLAAWSVAAVPPRSASFWLVAALAATSMALAIVQHTPSDNDVWFTVQGGADALLRGENPFTRCWPGNPDPKTDCVYAYLPMTSVVLVPSRLLFGDVRFGSVIALVIAAWVIYRLAAPRWAIPLATALLVVGAPLADRAWTEPLLLAGFAIIVWAASTGWIVPVLALAAVLAFKQHMILVLPLAAWWPRIGPTRAILAAVLAGATTLPWLLADPAAFLDDTLWFHLGLQPRADSLSLYALATRSDVHLPTLAGAVVVGGGTAAAMALAMARAPRTAYGFALGSALVLFAFNLLNKQSFYNHHALVVGLLLLAAAIASAAPRRQPEVQAAEAGPTPESLARAPIPVADGA